MLRQYQAPHHKACASFHAFLFSSSSTQVHSFCCCGISRNLLCFSRPLFTMTLYKQFVCITFLFLALTQFVLSGKQKDVRRRTTGTRASTVPEEDLTHRTLLQWQRQPLESLRLACANAHLVSTGSRGRLAVRLYEFYQQQQEVPSTSSGSSPLEVTPTVAPVTPRDLIRTSEFQVALREELHSFLTSFSSLPQEG